MKFDQVFGILLILLAIYLGVTAARGGVSSGQFGGFGEFGGFEGFGGVGEPIEVPAAPDGGGDAGSAADGSSADDDNGTGGGGDDADGAGGGSTNGDGGASAAQWDDRELVVTRSTFCAAAVPADSQYRDLGQSHDAAIRCVEMAGITTGRSSTQYDPNDAVTRGGAAMAMAATIDAANEHEAEGVDLQALPDANDARFQDFKDSSADCPGERAVARLNESPVLQGYVDARYEPCGKVTRAQMASMLDRTYQYMNSAALPIGPDQFRDDDTSVHEESINAVAAAEIMPGVTAHRFAPRRSVLRGEMASYIARMLIRMEDKGRIEPLS
jgi:hypothetical protein